MSDKPASVKEYLDSLSDDRRKALNAIRKTIRANLDKPFKEGIQYGMLGYFLPHSVYPDGYHCDPKQPLPFLSVASQKNYISIYLFCVYLSEEAQERFREEWLASGKKLNMGKSCVRVKTLDDIPLDVLGKTIKRIKAKPFVASYVAGLALGGKGKKKAAKKKVARKS